MEDKSSSKIEQEEIIDEQVNAEPKPLKRKLSKKNKKRLITVLKKLLICGAKCIGSPVDVDLDKIQAGAKLGLKGAKYIRSLTKKTDEGSEELEAAEEENNQIENVEGEAKEDELEVSVDIEKNKEEKDTKPNKDNKEEDKKDNKDEEKKDNKEEERKNDAVKASGVVRDSFESKSKESYKNIKTHEEQLRTRPELKKRAKLITRPDLRTTPEEIFF